MFPTFTVYWWIGLIQALACGLLVLGFLMFPKDRLTEQEMPIMYGLAAGFGVLTLFGLLLMVRG